MPYRAQRGGQFGGGPQRQEGATIDVTGAIDALMGGTAGLIRQAMLRKEQQRQLERQAQQDKLAAEDRTRAIEQQTFDRSIKERDLATRDEDRKLRLAEEARKRQIEDAKLRAAGFTPPRTSIAGSMGIPGMGSVPMLHHDPASFDPKKSASYQIEQETDAREHRQDLELEDRRAKNSRIAAAMARQASRTAEQTPVKRDQAAAQLAESAVRATGGDPLEAMRWMDANEKNLATQLGLTRRHYHEAAGRLRAEQEQADRVAAARLVADGFEPEEAATTVARTRAATTRPTLRRAAAPAAAGNPTVAGTDTGAAKLARAKAALDRIPLGSPNRKKAEAIYKSLGGKL